MDYKHKPALSPSLPSLFLSYFLEKENRVKVKSKCDSQTLPTGTGEDVGEREPSLGAGGTQHGAAALEDSLAVSCQAKYAPSL